MPASCWRWNTTHDLASFGREKVLPGIAYLKDPAYQARFGTNAGRWLVVTLGTERRLRSLMDRVRQVGGEDAGLFWLTTFDQLAAANPLCAPIWHQAGREVPFALFSGTASRLE